MTHVIHNAGLPIPLAAGLEELLGHVNPHDLVRLGPFTVTNHTLMSLIAATLMILVFGWMGAAARNPVPSGLRNLFEAIMSYMRTEVFRPVLGIHADRFTPFLWNVFFFILFCNLLGMIPFGSMLGLMNPDWKHLGGTATGNIGVTAALAACAFLMIHVSGIVQNVRMQMDPGLDPHHAHHADKHGHYDTHNPVVGKPLVLAIPYGLGTYVWNYAPHPEMGNPIADVGMWAVLLVMEMAGTIIKPFALCIRLFANMLAGHLLLAAVIGLVPFGIEVAWGATLGVSIPVVLGCIALSMLELLVAFLQAYIFTFLTAMFIGTAVAPEH